MKPLKVVVLASGSGTLFQALVDAQSTLGIEILALVADVECGAIQRAHKAGIPTRIVAVQNDREQWDAELAETLTMLNPELIVSAGFMRILGESVLARFEGAIINTHPALLPNFPGAHAVRDALAAGATRTGTTVHFVDAGMDTGRIIAQREVDVLPDDTEATLHERIKVVERQLLVDTVGEFARGTIHYRESSD